MPLKTRVERYRRLTSACAGRARPIEVVVAPFLKMRGITQIAKKLSCENPQKFFRVFESNRPITIRTPAPPPHKRSPTIARLSRPRRGADTRRRTMYAALSSKLSTASLRIAPSHRVADAKPRTAVIECAHKKGTGSVKNGRDGNAKYLGVKKYGEEKVTTGCIIVRQRGNKVRVMRVSCVSSVAVRGGA